MNALLRRGNSESKRRAKTVVVKIGSPIAGHPPAEGISIRCILPRLTNQQGSDVIWNVAP